MTIFPSIDYQQPNESTFLCPYRTVRRYGTTQSAASSYSQPSSYLIHEVKSDDSLERLALKYNCSVTSLVRANKLWSPAALLLKERIRIPIFDSSKKEKLTPQANFDRTPSQALTRVDKKENSMDDILSRIDKNINSFKNYELPSNSIVFDEKCA